MKIYIWLVMLLVASGTGFSVLGQKSMTLEELRKTGKKKQAEKMANNKPLPDPKEGNVKEVTQLIKEGAYSGIKEPFVFVARDDASYRLLVGMVDGLEPDSSIDFQKSAVIAAFSGEKATGGYAVRINAEEGKYEIEDVSPPHGAIVTEALTTPFAIVTVPTEEEASLLLRLDGTWSSRIQKYRVTEGSFEFSGGFLGRSTKFGIVGTIGLLQHENLVSLFFDLKEQKEDQQRVLDDIGSGNFAGDAVQMRRIEGGNFIDRPHPPLGVSGTIADGEMVLSFRPGKRPYIVSDGFEGRGELKAELITVN